MNPTTTSTAGRRFHLLEVIGEGAYGEVYLAEQDSGAGFRRKVAIKLLHAHVAKVKDAGRRMRDEARMLGMLSHRNIVTVQDLILLGDRWAVIMDHVPGSDVEQILEALASEGARVPPRAAFEIASGVCAALDFAYHAEDRGGQPMRVVHRDIKPSNIRIATDGEVKVLDFGVARVQLDSREAATRGSAWLGTERYMSPERILCESDDAPGDVYATAATLIEMLLGRPLGRTPVLDERHLPFVQEAVQEALLAMPGAHAEIGALLLDGLAADPEARPTAAEFGSRCREIARKLGAVESEDLVAFAARLLPEIPRRLGLTRRAASGILSATSTHTGRPPAVPSELNAETILPPEEVSAIQQKGLLPMLGLAGVLAAGALALFMIAAVLLLGYVLDPRSGSPVVTVPEPPVPLVPVTPEPVPVEPTGVEATDPPAATDVPVPSDPPITPAPSDLPVPVPATPVPTAPVPLVPVPVPDPAPSDAARINSAMVVVTNGTGISVVCGETVASGTASARLRDFPAGPCTVNATYLGTSYTTEVSIMSRREVRCAVEGSALRCQ